MSRRAAINTGLSVAGVALLIWQVQDAGGVAAVRRGLASVGAGFAAVLVLSFLRFLMRAIAWRALLGEPAPVSAALAATISGDALGNITPFGLAASEPAKAFYIGRHLDRQRAFAALAAENFFYSVSVAVYMIAGVVAMLVAFDELPIELRQGGIAALLLMAGHSCGRWLDRVAQAGDGERRAAAPAADTGRRARRIGCAIWRGLTYGSAAHEGARLGQMALAETTFHALSLAESWLVLYLHHRRPVAADRGADSRQRQPRDQRRFQDDDPDAPRRRRDQLRDGRRRDRPRARQRPGLSRSCGRSGCSCGRRSGWCCGRGEDDVR